MLAWVGFSLLSIAAATPQLRHHSLTGNFETIPAFYSSILNNRRTIIVYLPPGYRTHPKQRYRVLYMQDGQNVFDGYTSFLPNEEWRADETAQALIQAKLIPPIIIVGVYNAGIARADEYLPTRVNGSGGHADEYGKMLTTELMPMIDSKFRTIKGAGNTGICGSSYGGVLSLYLGLKLPSVFGKVIAMSPTLFWDNDYMIHLIEAYKSRERPKIWLDVGTAEGGKKFEKLMVSGGTEADQALRAKGWKEGRDLAFYIDYGAQHNEIAWSRRLGMALMFEFSSH